MNKKTQPMHDWTVMVFMAGDNNLSQEGADDLRRMKTVGSSEQLAILAQFDRAKKTGTKRYYLRRGGHYHNDEIDDLGETNTGDPKILRDFLTWGMTNYPAKHYLVILWGHATGVLDRNYWGGALPGQSRQSTGSKSPGSSPASNDATFKAAAIIPDETPLNDELNATAFGPDENPGAKEVDFLTNPEFKKVFAQTADKLGRKIDILGLDACQMSMLEVGFQIRESVNLMVASQNLTPEEGWPYDLVLKAIHEKPAITPRALSKLVVQTYLQETPEKKNPTLTVTDLSQFTSGAVNRLDQAVDALANAMIPALAVPATRRAILAARLLALHVGSVEDPDAYDYIDLYDFCERLESICENDELIACCRAVKRAYGAQATVIAAGGKGPRMHKAHGVTIYFPTATIDTNYRANQLDFLRETDWLAFLKKFIRAAQKERMFTPPTS